jgi:hypothetical protein
VSSRFERREARGKVVAAGSRTAIYWRGGSLCSP